MADNKHVAFTSPAGLAVFPWITAPDIKFTATGKYHTGLAVPPEDGEEFITFLETVRDDFIATLSAAKRQALNPVPVYQDELSRPVFPEDATPEQIAEIKHNFLPEPTGNVLFKFNLRAQVDLPDGKSFTQAPIVVSAETDEPVEGAVFDGSIIRVRGQVVPYTNTAAGTVGVTLRMRAVQVIEQVGGSSDGGGSGSTFWTEFDS